MRIVAWLAMSALIGYVFNNIVGLDNVLAAGAVFALPFVVIGFQYNERAEFADGVWQDKGAIYRQLTFWGIPVGRETLMASYRKTPLIDERTGVFVDGAESAKETLRSLKLRHSTPVLFAPIFRGSAPSQPEKQLALSKPET
ncbi:hypothetical protein [Paracraurococcus lichenis]|uniref:PH domain-containing protein n=1 Tax=Paracraurococcus lichenis TaxID=3064888 RepID=A0ABT9DUG4_9PROT|nr:hypothetical protein [Paracraurococcus sp. LOR1-02]MDO9707534.1 hypothetical protein [Paracraurococcus sp. LOR1-02]